MRKEIMGYEGLYAVGENDNVMRKASTKVFGKPLALRGQFRREGTSFICNGVTVEVG